MNAKLKSIGTGAIKMIAPIILGYIGGYIAFERQNSVNELDRLNDNSDQLISIEMQYPYVLDSVYIESWSKHPHSEDDSSNRYQSYCEALFDYMEKTCEYYNYDKKKLDNYIDIPSVIGMHKFWWLMPEQQTTDDSINSLDFYKFRDYINTFYK